MASKTKVKFVGLVPFDEIVDFIRFRMEDVIGLVYFKTEIIQKNEKPYRPLKYPDIVVNGTTLIEQKVLMEVLYHNENTGLYIIIKIILNSMLMKFLTTSNTVLQN